MKNLDELQGQPVAKTMLQKYLQGKLPPLLILSGTNGTGRWSAAEALIRQSFCEVGTACDRCAACRKINKGEHPDYIQFPAEKIRIGNKEKPEIHTIRWLLQKRMPYTPFEGGKRFIIFPRADLIQNEAETALLKTLEETPEHTRFIFLVERPEQLKATILSRGVIIPFQRLNHIDIQNLSGSEFPQPILNFLGGSIEMLPFLTTRLAELMDEQIDAALEHPLSMMETENWLKTGERNNFSDISGEDEFQYEDILEIFSLRLLLKTENHPKRFKIANAIMEFKKELHRNLAGMNPFYCSRLFHELYLIIHT